MISELLTVFFIAFSHYRVLTCHSGENIENIIHSASPDPRYGMDGQAIEPAVQYVQKIKQRCDPETYRQFLDILSRFHHTPDTIDEVRCTFISLQVLDKILSPGTSFKTDCHTF